VWPCTSSSSSIFLPKTAFQLINYRNPPHSRRDSSSPVFSHLLLRCCLLVMRWTMGHFAGRKIHRTIIVFWMLFTRAARC
jgi:hypothetical protein